MKKFIQLLAFFVAVSSVVMVQSCKEDDPLVPPTLTAPSTVASVQVGAKADVTFTFTAAEGYASSSVTAVGGTATVKTPPAADAAEGSVVVEFTADNTPGAASVTLTLKDMKDQSISQSATLNKTISAPPSVALSAASGSANPGSTVKVTATITAPNGAKTLTYTTTNGLTGSPASPITLSGTTQELTFTIPATAAVGATYAVAITATDNQNLNSTAATFTVTAIANELTGTLTSDLTIEKGTLYLIKGAFVVPSGKTLTVKKGAVVRGDKATKGVLIVKQGGTLIAEGTAEEPIVFTSSQPAGERDRGDWGGIVLMGDAYVNQSAKPAVEGLSAPAGDADFYKYGTPSQADANAGNNTQNSGTLKYVRIEYAGIELIPNSETNGLTLAAVGNGTTIDFVQSSYGGDDAFEWFGGTVSAKHLVSLATWDDDFDTDFGWRGNVQFAVAVRAPFVADQSGSTAFESDSQGNGNAIGTVCDSPAGGTGAVPTASVAANTGGCTQGVFSNVTVFGPREYSRSISGNFTRAMHIRRRTAISIFNSVITGFPGGLTMDDQGTLDNYTGGIGVFKNNVLVQPILPTSASNSAFASGNFYYGSNASGAVSGAGGATGTVANLWEGGSAIVKGFVATKTDGTFTTGFAKLADATTTPAIINPYTDLGLPYDNTFYADKSAASYTSNPSFSVTSGSIQGLNASDLFPATSKVDNAFFDKTITFKGAFGSTDWTDTWTEWVPLNKVY